MPDGPAASSSAARSPSRRCSPRSTRPAAGHDPVLRRRGQRAGQRPPAAALRPGCAVRGRRRLRRRAHLRAAAGRRRDPGPRGPPAAGPATAASAACRGSRCRCWRAPSSGPSTWPRPMDARGYGRTTDAGRVSARVTAALVFGGLLGVCIGIYGAARRHGVDLARHRRCWSPACVVAAAGLRLGGRRTARTRYRPDPWALPGVARRAAPGSSRRRPCSSTCTVAPPTSASPARPPCRRCRCWPTAGDPGRAAARVRRPAAAAAALPSGPAGRRRPPATGRGGGGVIRFEHVSRHVHRRAGARARRRRPDDPRGRAVPGRRAAPASGKSTLLRRGQRARAALHRRHAARPGHGRRPRHPHPPAARTRRRRRHRGPGPARRLRHRHRRGRARLRHGVARAAAPT